MDNKGTTELKFERDPYHGIALPIPDAQELRDPHGQKGLTDQAQRLYVRDGFIQQPADRCSRRKNGPLIVSRQCSHAWQLRQRSALFELKEIRAHHGDHPLGIVILTGASAAPTSL